MLAHTAEWIDAVSVTTPSRSKQHRVVVARIGGERQLHGPRSLLVLVDDGAAIEHLRCSSW